MFSLTIFKQAIRTNYFIWLVVTMTTTVFLITTIFAVESLSASGATLPNSDGNFFSLLDQTFFSMIGILIPLIYIVVVSNRIISKEVDNGSMAFALTTPIGRTKLIMTRIIFILTSIFVMFAIITLGGLAALSTLSNQVEMRTFIDLMINLLSLELSFAGVAILMTSIFNKSSVSLGLGSGLTLGMFLISILSTISSDLESLKYFSLIQFYNVKEIISDSLNLTNNIILLLVFLALALIATQVFKNKNLPL